MSLFSNTNEQFSLLAKLFHWFTLLAVIFLFALGLWMTELDYYDDWYKKSTGLHISIGVTLAIFTGLRLGYRWLTTYPKPIAGPRYAELAAKAAHLGLYALLVTLFVTGYVIVTIEGEALSVFGIVEIPAIFHSKGNLQDAIGEVHEIGAFMLIALTCIHGGAALWHHFKLRDNTLRRMLTKAKR
jgi:cytochrome b561